MNLARLLRFFGLRPRHAPGYRARLSLRMSRVFHRRSWSMRRSSAMTSSSDHHHSNNHNSNNAVTTTTTNNNNNGNNVAPHWSPEATPGEATASTITRRRRLGSTLYIPENEPVALDWGTGGSASSMDLRRSSRARQVDVESRLLVQRLILEELQSHSRRRHRRQRHKQPETPTARDARMAMLEHAEALSAAFLEGRGSELLPPTRPSTLGEAGAPVTARTQYGAAAAAAVGATGDSTAATGDAGGGGAHQLTRKEEKKLRKSVARAVRCDEKQQKKLEKLNKQRAKQYARAQAFFEQTTGAMQDVSLYRSSFDVPRGADTFRFDVNAGDARWRRLSSSESLSSSLTRFSKQGSDSSSLARSRTKPPRMEFLFFGGNAEDAGWSDLEFGYQQFRPSTSAAVFGVSGAAAVGTVANSQRTSYAESIKINPTLVRAMPRPFVPRMNGKEIFI